jgi:hypothetical protein
MYLNYRRNILFKIYAFLVISRAWLLVYCFTKLIIFINFLKITFIIKILLFVLKFFTWFQRFTFTSSSFQKLIEKNSGTSFTRSLFTIFESFFLIFKWILIIKIFKFYFFNIFDCKFNIFKPPRCGVIVRCTFVCYLKLISYWTCFLKIFSFINETFIFRLAH